MKVGSLVELVDDIVKNGGNGEIKPIRGIIYTVRDIIPHEGNVGIRLMEIINKPAWYSDGFDECIFNIKKFRELQPPIANIEEHINENTLEPELI